MILDVQTPSHFPSIIDKQPSHTNPPETQPPQHETVKASANPQCLALIL